MRESVGGGSDPRRAVFLDRDGVINRNRDGDYVRTPDDFEFLPGALEAVAALNRAGCTVVIVSNQAGVGSGLIAPGELERINDKMLRTISEAGGEVASVRYCTHRKDEGCSCRKPETGLFTEASRELGFPLEGSYFVGDAESDVLAGRRAGCTTVIVLTGRSSASEIESWASKPDFVARDLPEAVEWIVEQEV